MRFMVMVRATKMTEAGEFPPDMEKLLAAMAAYNEELVKAGVMLDGAGLQPSSKGARIRFSGDKVTVLDGPFAEAKEQLAGYLTVDCESVERAVEIAARWPDAKRWAMEVRPVMTPDAGAEM